MEINQENQSEPIEVEQQQQAVDELADKLNAEKPAPQRSSRIRTWLYIGFVVLGLIAGLVWLAIEEAKKIPEFYAQVLKQDPVAAQKAGQQFERNLVKLQNAARRIRPWKVEFTEQQVNGWFSSDLPEKFPDAIPTAISSPRVVFHDDEIKLAFKYEFRGATGYVVLLADLFCTDQPTEIGVQIRDVKTGFVSLPVGPWMDRVADSIRKAGIPIYWKQDGETPVAIFTLPDHIRAHATNEVIVEAISLKDKRLIIAGKTKRSKPAGQEKDSKPDPAKKPEPAKPKQA